MNNKEMQRIVIVAFASLFLVLGILIGKASTIHNCYMVSENESTYVLNFNGTEHLYLK